jgi:hypothetical protein
MFPQLARFNDFRLLWHTGFWGEKTDGWHYHLIFVIMNLLILFTDGERYALDILF